MSFYFQIYPINSDVSNGEARTKIKFPLYMISLLIHFIFKYISINDDVSNGEARTNIRFPLYRIFLFYIRFVT